MGSLSFVHTANAHRVGTRPIVLVPCALIPAGPTHVVLADTIALGPEIISWEWHVCQMRSPSTQCHRRCCQSFFLSQSIWKFLVGHCEQRDQSREPQVGGSELLKDSVVIQSCKGQVVESHTDAIDSRGGRRGHNVGPPKRFAPSNASSWHWHLRGGQTEGHLPGLHQWPGGPPTHPALRGKCWAARTAAKAIISSLTLTMGMPSYFAFFCASSIMTMNWGTVRLHVMVWCTNGWTKTYNTLHFTSCLS
jgi:hypothetical protein